MQKSVPDLKSEWSYTIGRLSVGVFPLTVALSKLIVAASDGSMSIATLSTENKSKAMGKN